ncbi:MAG: glycerophosphodiester phosphodiesterase [Haloarculaceae archaeon]
MTIDVIAHRGFAGVFPENTAAAVTAAGLHPEVRTVEVDTMPCADGTPVVFHDARLDERDDGSPGLTDARGVVWETDRETVTGAEVLDSGWTVPTLAAVVRALPTGVRLNVELKNPGSFDVRPGEKLRGAELETQRDLWGPFVGRVLDVLDPLDRVLLSSFCEAAVAEAADRSTRRTAPLCPPGGVEAGLAVAREHGSTAFHPAKESVFEDPWTVDRAVEAGCEVNAWTARTWHDVRCLREAGVHGVVADYPTLTLAGGR